MGYKELFTDLGFKITEQIGKELIAVCPNCSKEENKFSISSLSGLCHCFSCGYASNAYAEIEKKHGLSGQSNFQYQYDFGIEFKPVDDPQNKEKIVSYPDYSPERLAHDSEIEEFCTAKGILNRDLRTLTSDEIMFRPNKADGPLICLPGYWPDCVSHPTAWWQAKIDGEDFIKGDQSAKYILIKGSTHGFIGLKRILTDDPETVIWAEGWKDAVAATNYGYHAVAGTGGSGSGWHKDWVELFRGKILYLIFDADKAGQRYAERVAPIIAAVAKAVFICHLPYEITPSQGKDLHDYCNEPGMNAARFQDELLDKSRAITAARSNVLPNSLPQTLAAELYYRMADHKIICWNGRWFRFSYKTKHYQELEIGKEGLPTPMVADTFRLCQNTYVAKKDKDGNTMEIPFAATQTLVNNIIKNYIALPDCSLAGHDNSGYPFWVSGDLEAKNTIALNNCLLYIGESDEPEILDLTDKYFNAMRLPYNYDSGAECPRWMEFMNESFWGPDGADQPSVNLLQEWCGLMLIPDTSYHTILGMIGAGGTGKGTILRVIERLVGCDNYGATDFSQLADKFGLEHLLHCTVAVIPDAHLGYKTCPDTAVKVLKAISGEDTITINRKYQTALKDCQMVLRFIISANTIQGLHDPSSALLRRWQFISVNNIVAVEKQDRHLSKKLFSEIQGIFNWALQGLYRLRKRGHFISPASVSDLDAEFKAVLAPMNVFLHECCNIGTSESIAAAQLFKAYQWWCEQENYKCSSKAKFSINLRAALNRVRVKTERQSGRSVRMYEGIALKEELKSIVATRF